jgi:eukaryotic-like serine/threonine-protein kinase
MGTMVYMSPEERWGRNSTVARICSASAWCCMKWRAGSKRFRAAPQPQFLTGFCTRRARPVELNPQLPLELEAIIVKALEKDRQLRYQTAGGLLADLKRRS